MMLAGVTTSFNAGFHQTEHHVPDWVIIGEHVPLDATYCNIGFRVPALQVWHSRANIIESWNSGISDNRRVPAYQVQAIESDVVHVNILNTDLMWTVGWKTKSDQYSSLSLDISSWVNIHPGDEQSLKWYMDQFNIISIMLSIIAGDNMGADCIVATITGSLQEVSIIFKHKYRCCGYRDTRDFFMPRDALNVDLSVLVNNWYSVFDSVRMPSILAQSTLGSDDLWEHVKYLAYMQILEGLHRALYPGKYMDEEEYNDVFIELCRAIPARVESNHRDALKQRLRYGNQVSLKKRINELAGRLSLELRNSIIGGDGNIQQRWMDTRNYYTHWDEDLRGNILDDEHMYYVNVRLELLVRAVIMDLMGIPQSSIQECLMNMSSTAHRLAFVSALDQV